MKLFEMYLKGAYATPFTQAAKEGFALGAITQTVAVVLFPAAPRRARVAGAYAAATLIGGVVLAVRGAREERPLEVLIAESNKRTATGLVRLLLAAQGLAEKAENTATAVGMVLRDARYGLAAAGGVSPLPYNVTAPVNTRRPASQEN